MKSKNDWVTKFLYRTYKDTNKSYIFGYEKDNPSYECFKTKILNQSSLGAKNEAEKTLYTKNLERARDFFKAKIADMVKVLAMGCLIKSQHIQTLFRLDTIKMEVKF